MVIFTIFWVHLLTERSLSYKACNTKRTFFKALTTDVNNVHNLQAFQLVSLTVVYPGHRGGSKCW